MSLPQNSHLPKPPPKTLPGARPPLGMPPSPSGGQAGLSPRPVMPSAQPVAMASHAVAAPSARPVATAAQPGKPVLTARSMPSIDIKSLPAKLGPMVEAIHIYDELLIEENTALKAGDSKTVESLLDRKMAATRLYQERLRALLADPQSSRTMAPDQRSEVVSMVKCLEERAKENTTLLKANMGAIEQLFEVINTAARKMRRQDVAYSKAGMMCDNYVRNGVSLAYNHTI
ncbi:MAG TPA: hypothetical protein VN809_00190 [Telmatospirillum sp.]|nr:hypothetical protein [Telmatospirillum sp.]